MEGSGDVTVLINHEGSIRLVQGTDWSLASLQELHGAYLAYRVTSGTNGSVKLLAREGQRTCTMESGGNGVALRMLAGGFPRYLLK